MVRGVVIDLVWLLFRLPAFPFADDLGTSEIGTIGEELADQFWQQTGRRPLLPPRFGNPNTHGPDRAYRTSGGSIELHETKAYNRWPNIGDLDTTAKGKPSMQLSKEWVESWISDSNSTFHGLSPDAQQAIRRGNFVRRVNFMNSSTGQLQVYELETVGQAGIKLGPEILPPYGLSRSRITSLMKQAQALTERSRLASNDKSLVSKARSHSVGKTDDPFKNLQKSDLARSTAGRVVPGVLTADGRLLVACGKGAGGALTIFTIDGGIACYQYWSGDIDKSALNEKLENAAIKSAAVGGGVGGAVLLGSGPGVILAIGIGSYIIADFAVQQWRENAKDRLLTLKDLTDMGVPVDPNISLNADHWSSQQDQ